MATCILALAPFCCSCFNTWAGMWLLLHPWWTTMALPLIFFYAPSHLCGTDLSLVWVVLNIGILVFNRLLHLWLAPADTGKHVWLRTQWAAKCAHGSRSFGDCKAWRTICVQALRSLALFLKWNVGLPSRPPEGLALPSCSGGGLFHHIDFKVVHLNFLPVALLLPFWRTSCRTTPTTSGCSRVGKSVRNRL